MLMTHSEKLERMRTHMAAIGVSPLTSAPPVWRLLWRLGVEAPPPLFSRFLPLAFVTGSFFGLLWAPLMWLMLWSRQDMPFFAVAAGALVSGLLFGLCMAAYFRFVARKHNLPLWAAYPTEQP